MSMTRITFALSFILLLAAGNASGQDKPALREIDRVRLAEAFRLSDQLADELWAGWSHAPLAVLLVTPDKEFLIKHPQPSKDFTSLGYDPKLKSEVFYRDRKFATNLLATFPAVGGISTIVIGQAENTASKTSTPWDFTTFRAAANQVHNGIVHELSTLKLEDYKRVAFYPIGAAEGLLLDRSNPQWRSRYFAEKFDNGAYFTRQ